VKPFSFRLEKVLRYKIQIEDRKKQILLERNNELNVERTRLDRLSAQCSLYQNRYSSLFKGRLNILGLLFSRRHLDKLDRDIVIQKNRVEKSEKKVEKAKADLQNAMRDRKKYEKLKERRKLEHEYEAGRSEQKELDEFGLRLKDKVLRGIAP
jgi:flagellar FliJ protein